MFKHEFLSSKNNDTVKWAATLADKKGRDKSSSFIAEGIKLTLEAISASLPITHIFVSESKADAVMSKIEEKLAEKNDLNVRLITLADSAFEKISTEKAPEGVISVIKHLDFFSNIDIIYKKDFIFARDERVMLLCSVRDPGNLGSVIRSAVAFGTDRIVLSDDCADIYNPKTVRSTMGSLFRVKISKVSNLADFIASFRAGGRRVFAAELTESAKSLKDISLNKSDAIVIGNEGHGIPKEISSLCDGSVYIPISNKTESLNASVAAAIFMWEQDKL